ncbi:1161_t:CDS:2 [Cetraspora pellucida]|uniref:1161_t:CDS:1 n=1 Tax=Cetraspora pellucida TaxID=1433469 RepID=A0ACA9LZJ5_9GLOM|nr:1161_t:CDS:2 [Cetraspora pellucida]
MGSLDTKSSRRIQEQKKQLDYQWIIIIVCYGSYFLPPKRTTS